MTMDACKIIKKSHRRILAACVLFGLFLLSFGSAYGADNIVGGILGAFVNGIGQQMLISEWKEIPRSVRECVAKRINVTPEQLAQKGIGPSDSRVVPYIQSCRQYVAQEEARKERERQIAEARREETEKRLAKVRAEQKAHHQELVRKFGEQTAESIEAGKVEIGMSKDAVIATKGQPMNKKIIPPDAALWIYRSQRVAFGGGKVTYVGH